MRAQQDHLAARLALGSDAMRDFLVSLSAQDRLAFADRLEERLMQSPKERLNPPKP
jgi:hypothetical protein